jgi:lysozyme
MIASKNCINLIKMFEGFKPKAYLCPVGKATLGFGSTFYQTGFKVKLGDTINEQKALELMVWHLGKISIALHGLTLNQNQVDACLSFIYNFDIARFNGSTLKKLILANPNNPLIKDEFLKWNKGKVDGKMTVIRGLTRRRTAEAELYFKK